MFILVGLDQRGDIIHNAAFEREFDARAYAALSIRHYADDILSGWCGHKKKAARKLHDEMCQGALDIQYYGSWEFTTSEGDCWYITKNDTPGVRMYHNRSDES